MRNRGGTCHAGPAGMAQRADAWASSLPAQPSTTPTALPSWPLPCVALPHVATQLTHVHLRLRPSPAPLPSPPQVNALAPMRLIRALAPKMCDKGEVGCRRAGGRVGGCFTGVSETGWVANGWVLHSRLRIRSSLAGLSPQSATTTRARCHAMCAQGWITTIHNNNMTTLPCNICAGLDHQHLGCGGGARGPAPRRLRRLQGKHSAQQLV